MPRAMTAAMATAFSAPVVRSALFVSMQFATDMVYIWSGLGPMTWNSMTFQGIGSLGSISTITEDSTVEARGIVLELSGIPSTLLGEVLTQTRVLGTVKIWTALFTSGGTIIADPVVSYQGRMDKATVEDSGDKATCSIAVENVLIDLNRPVYRRYTNDDQQQDFPGDTGFRFVPGIQERVTFWGRTPSSVNNT